MRRRVESISPSNALQRVLVHRRGNDLAELKSCNRTSTPRPTSSPTRKTLTCLLFRRFERVRVHQDRLAAAPHVGRVDDNFQQPARVEPAHVEDRYPGGRVRHDGVGLLVVDFHHEPLALTAVETWKKGREGWEMVRLGRMWENITILTFAF